jgi:hypothetical protein
MKWSSMFAVLTAGGLAIACSSGSKGLSVRASAAGDTTTTGGDVLKLNNDTITVDRVRMVVRRVEIEGTPTSGACTPTTTTPPATPTTGTGTTTAPSSGSDDHGGMSGGTSGSGGSGDGGSGGGSDDGSGHDGEGDDDGECELEFGPFAVDLTGSALVQGIHQQFDIPVPAGTYREIKFKIDTINAEKAGSDAVLADMAAQHASIAIDGTIDGTPFHFTTPMEVESKHEGAITVDPSTGAGLTLDISPTTWFTAADGTTRLDPNSTTDQGAILANLRASLRLAHDDDMDGCDDDDAAGCEDHHGDGGGGSGHR